MNFKGKKISVLGAGETGVSSAVFLKERGAHVHLSEQKKVSDCYASEKILREAGVSCEFGGHTWGPIKGSELAIVSPGIPPTSDICKRLTRSKIPVWSEIELASRVTDSEIIAVTGTNGKTTVTTLLANVLRTSGRKVVSCGNIGNAFIGEVSRLDKQTLVVLEVSSFQLANINQFHPNVAVLLNLSANHLDWHGSFEAYCEAKLRLFKNQTTEDLAIVNHADRLCVEKTKRVKAKTIYFDPKEAVNANEAAVLAVAELYGVPRSNAEIVLRKCQGLPHRLEPVGEVDGISYVNDSKSTTIASLNWALTRMTSGTILIAGGRHKGGDFRALRGQLSANVKTLIVIGEAQHAIEDATHDVVPVRRAESLQQAVELARKLSVKGQTVLLSPACASFDQFQDYEDRGNQFKEMVKKLQTSSQAVKL